MMVNKRMLAMMRGAMRYIAACVAYQWVSLLGYVGIILAMVFLLRQTFAGTVEPALLLGALCTIGVLVVVRVVCIQQSAQMGYRSSVRVKGMLREKLYGKILDLGMSYAQDVRTSEVLQMAGEGVEQLETYFGRYLPQLVYSLLAPLTLFVVMAYFSLLPAVVLLVCVPLIPISIILVSRRARRVFTGYWNRYTDLGTEFLESLQGLTTLKIFKVDALRQKDMERNAEGFRVATMRLLATQLASVTIIDLVAYGGAALGILVALLQFRAGVIDMTGCLVIILLASEFFVPLRLLASSFHVAMNGVTACDKMFALFDIEAPPQTGLALKGTSYDIKIEGLSFGYAKPETAGCKGDGCQGDVHLDNPDNPGPGHPAILRDVSLSLPQGSLIALVGESGCGKSTLCALLCGVRTGYEGSIRIGGLELRDVARASLSQQVVLVSTNAHIFKGTVAENLRIASASATDEQLWEVLERVELAGFLRGEQGLETSIQEGAANLSGGQRQRLALARALLYDAPVYLFDEATSNVDAESEHCILEVIGELARTRTVLFISHRLANVVHARSIHVLKGGSIVEQGSHEQLMARGKEYATMYNQQRSLEQFVPENTPNLFNTTDKTGKINNSNNNEGSSGVSKLDEPGSVNVVEKVVLSRA
jgi:ABC-type transport system involved in cytochrome bd biosynthesis fused ATPase/permease subunit